MEPNIMTTKSTTPAKAGTKSTKSTHAVSGTTQAVGVKATMGRLVTDAMLTSTAVAVKSIDLAETKATDDLTDATWQAFWSTVDAYVALWASLKSTWQAPAKAAGATFSADGLVKAWKDRTSDIYVTTDERGNLPTESRIGRAYGLSSLTPAMRVGFKASGNSAKLTDLLPYVARMIGTSSDTNTSILPTESVAAGQAAVKASGVKVADGLAFKVTRKASSRESSASVKSSRSWVKLETADDDALKVAAQFSNLENYNDEQLVKLAECVVATIMLRAKVAETVAAPVPAPVPS